MTLNLKMTNSSCTQHRGVARIRNRSISKVTRAQFEALVAATGYETRANCRVLDTICRQNWIGGTLGSSKRDLILSFA